MEEYEAFQGTGRQNVTPIKNWNPVAIFQFSCIYLENDLVILLYARFNSEHCTFPLDCHYKGWLLESLIGQD